MDSPKYLIIITLVDGQNFTVPDGAPDKVEATVFAEARFANESILRSDPIKLTNSNPEFVTELAWQLDKKSLHQMRVERRSIKLQVFMQTRQKRKTRPANGTTVVNGYQGSDDSSSNRVELVGYTVIDIRSAQERNLPRFQWLPLLNPKFRKPSYNRPEVQLALTLRRIEGADNDDSNAPLCGPSSIQTTDRDQEPDINYNSSFENQDIDGDSLNDSNHLYRTCLDTTTTNHEEKDEIIDNDIQIHMRDNCCFIYDAHDPEKFTIEDCDVPYRVTITIPFNSDLHLLSNGQIGDYYFSVDLFGSSTKTKKFRRLDSIEPVELKIDVYTTYPTILATYFELNPSFVIKLHRGYSNDTIGMASIQIDQLCSLDAKCRSIEGIFALQPTLDIEHSSNIHPSVGVSVVLEKLEKTEERSPERTPNRSRANSIDKECDTSSLNHEPLTNSIDNRLKAVVDEYPSQLLREHYVEDFEDLVLKSYDDSNQLTIDQTFQNDTRSTIDTNRLIDPQTSMTDPCQQDHHFCFTIDLKKFTYTQDQRLIPTLRELVVRYAYPFFGYKDTITTDASIPISPTNSIIVSGFCEFNFATSYDSLLAALSEIPLHLDILACDQPKRVESDGSGVERIVATCDLNLASILELSSTNPVDLENAIAKTISATIYGMNGEVNGQLQVYLSLQNRGKPKMTEPKTDTNEIQPELQLLDRSATITKSHRHTDQRKFDAFIEETRANIEDWKEKSFQKLSEELRLRENERIRRIQQRFEAKDSKREQEFKEKMKDLNNLEKRFTTLIMNVESLEKMLTNSFDQLKTKDALLDSRLETMDLKISKAVNDVKLEFSKKNNFYHSRFSRSADDNLTAVVPDPKNVPEAAARISTFKLVPSGDNNVVNQMRRSSLKNGVNQKPASIPIPVRSSSLVRGVVDGSMTRFVRKPPGFTATVVNELNPKTRSNSVSNKSSLSKETQEKLASLRREKAELLKRGCRPNDELIKEINSLIEKLAC